MAKLKDVTNDVHEGFDAPSIYLFGKSATGFTRAGPDID